MSGLIAMGADHAGYALKESLKTFLESRDFPVRDFGCFSLESCDYPDVAAQVARSIQNHEAVQGILCCGSGVGMAIAANRFPKVRAVVCQDPHIAACSRHHNDANIICFGARMIAPEYAQELAEIFLTAPFDGGRHQRRVDKMTTLLQGEPSSCSH